MPKQYGARCRGMKRFTRSSFVSVVLSSCRIELGPTRRDPHGTFPMPHEGKSVLQGASAKGGSVVTNRDQRRVSGRAVAAHERQPSRVMPRSTTFEFGVSVLARSAHVNRASTQLGAFGRRAARMPLTTVGCL